MKSVVYARISGHSCMWHVSLDIRADLAHWFGGRRNPLRIWMLEPALSFGQAILLTERLSSMKWKAEQVSSPSLMLEAVSRQAELLGVPLGLSLDKPGAPLAGQADKHGTSQGGRRDKLEAHLRECDWQQWAGYRTTEAGARAVLPEELLTLISIMQGRSLLLEEVSQLMEHHGLIDAGEQPLLYIQMGYLRGELQISQGIQRSTKRIFPTLRTQLVYTCQRCGSGIEHMVMTDCLFCEASCPYCEQCLTMGRSRYCSVMVSAAERVDPIAGFDKAVGNRELEPKPNFESEFDPQPGNVELYERYILPWGLSNVQAEASSLALQFLKANESQFKHKSGQKPGQFLIWAVTGAGKTEMIFPMIQYMLHRGKHVVVATPRRDVVLELRPRLEKAFAPTPVVTLYGGSEQRWDTGTLTIATTHQLLRFERAFDLVVIDELDAFPFHNNPMLEYAAHKVCTKTGVTLLLSATPPKQLQKAARRGQLPHVKVAARYHRHPLPVPLLLAAPALSQQLKRVSLHRKLEEKLAASLQRGAQLFVFVPKIQLIEPLVGLLRTIFPEVTVQGTSSKDEQRAQKVIDFRNSIIRILVTTTILERGVTIAKSDVFVLDADASLFDSASLVQMAGRAGRSAADPAGHVYFVAKERTRDQVEAIRQIKSMNTLARKKGYLRTKGEVIP
ncbi:DEAD/DEAH box helicase [Paenibacillus agricola]|uniref:DEAD/DEAH box helicase n=1 Tax=Paenibacillus agricola TaxID=2716264 RepID=A0ABX0JBI9_9BACL|nr:DEAD/DEAH box helicase [Paenibacillus agricola]NHN33860.1 DEAD/DEAH box helicase [Paenibacillus agricola]